jgi:hypothetical protein
MHWRPQTLEKAQVYLQIEKETIFYQLKKHINFKVIDFNSVKDYIPRDSRVYFEGFTPNAPFIRWFENCDR